MPAKPLNARAPTFYSSAFVKRAAGLRGGKTVVEDNTIKHCKWLQAIRGHELDVGDGDEDKDDIEEDNRSASMSISDDDLEEGEIIEEKPPPPPPTYHKNVRPEQIRQNIYSQPYRSRPEKRGMASEGLHASRWLTAEHIGDLY